MKDISMLLPTPAPDLVGACSLLFELGGLTVIHDAAGCMENYAVFDEPRWYKGSAMTYSSGLKHMDAVLGDEDRLISQLADAAETEKPAFIAIVGSPVPYTLGMDLDGVAAEVVSRTGIPSFALQCGGFAPYDAGIADALLHIVRLFCKKSAHTEKRSVNLLGATPLDLSDAEKEGMCSLLSDEGVKVKSLLCMGASVEDIRRAGEAEANLVISYGGLAAARYMRTAFGIPYACGLPINAAHARLLCSRLFDGAQSMPAMINGARCLVLGEQIYAASMAEALRLDGIDAAAGVTMSLDRAEMSHIPALYLPEEQDIALTLNGGYDVIAGDPLYGLLSGDKTKSKYVSRPHTALSSRLYARPAEHYEIFCNKIKENVS